VSACPEFLESRNPRVRSCARCAHIREAHPEKATGLLPRDRDLERRLLQLACDAGGHPSEELADCSSYLTWGLVRDHAGYMAGEPDATARFERRLRALVHVVDAWRDLHTEAH
jgi:hypothetical protein